MKNRYENLVEKGKANLSKMHDATLTTTAKPPKPQPYLNSTARKIFKGICEHIIKHNILCEIDSFYISAVAHNFEMYSQMASIIADKEAIFPGSGYFQTFANGTRQNSPEYNLMSKAFDIIEKGCRNLGMTPKSRDSILAFAAKDKGGDDESEELNLN